MNGVSRGRKVKDGYRIVWDDVVYEPGTVEVVAYRNGREWARDRVLTAGKAVRVEASVDYDGEDLVYVTTDIVDRKGTLVPDAADELTFSVKGPAVVLATDAGDPTSHVPFYSATLPAFHGKASAIIRRMGPGPVSVTVKARGLKSATIGL